MSSERTIEELVADLAPVRRIDRRRDAGLLSALGAIELALFLALGEARPDLMTAMAGPAFWWKLLTMGALTIVAVTTALRSFDPVASPRPGLRAFVILVGVALIGGWAIDSWRSDDSALLARLAWRHGIECVFAMVVLSLPPIVALSMLMRRGAPTDRSGSALAVGLAGAAWGTCIFVLNCPSDDPVYVAVWYVIGCALIALAARMILPSVARW